MARIEFISLTCEKRSDKFLNTKEEPYFKIYIDGDDDNNGFDLGKKVKKNEPVETFARNNIKFNTKIEIELWEDDHSKKGAHSKDDLIDAKTFKAENADDDSHSSTFEGNNARYVLKYKIHEDVVDKPDGPAAGVLEISSFRRDDTNAGNGPALPALVRMVISGVPVLSDVSLQDGDEALDSPIVRAVTKLEVKVYEKFGAGADWECISILATGWGDTVPEKSGTMTPAPDDGSGRRYFYDYTLGPAQNAAKSARTSNSRPRVDTADSDAMSASGNARISASTKREK